MHFFLESLRSVLLSMELRVGNHLFRAQLLTEKAVSISIFLYLQFFSFPQQFFMVCTLIDHTYDVKMFKTQVSMVDESTDHEKLL